MKRLVFACTIWAVVSVAILFGDQIRFQDESVAVGTLKAMQAGFVVLEVSEGSGIIQTRHDPERITALLFEDEGFSLEDKALRRSKLQPLLSLEDAGLLTSYLQNLVENGQPLTALSYAKLWHPKNHYTQLDSEYRTLLISAALASEEKAEALTHARGWLEKRPAPHAHPLPWQVCAEALMAEGEFEAALWLVSEPLAHAELSELDRYQTLQSIAQSAREALAANGQSSAPSLASPSLTFDQLRKTQSTP